jgi:negative regulator of flagellin synthesis FlgM
VTSKIGGYDNRPVPLSTGGSVQRARSGEDSAKPAATGTEAAANPIQITEQARQLGALEQAIGQASGFDELRVSSLRQSIEDGTYQISPERIADQLLKTEFDLRA